MRLGLTAAALAIISALAAGTVSARAEEPGTLLIGLGTWETLRSNDLAGELDLAYRSGIKWWIFHPHAGLLVATDGDYYGYAGLLTDIPLTDHIIATWSEALGGYGGGGYHLGSHFEFRSGLDVAWRFDDASRIGVGFYHISNAGITRANGGSESAILSYSIPVGP